MKIINKSTVLYFFWFVVLIAAVVAVWLFLSRKISSKSELSVLMPPPSDTITTQTLTNGNRLITNATARYEVIVSSTWYLERKAGSGIAVYPDYDPTKKVPPTCKIEISVLQDFRNADIDDWLTDYLRKDPTADVIESSRMSSTVSGHSAITWMGSLNGISTTLAYISREDGSVYEVAPSFIETGGTSGVSKAPPDVGLCPAEFQSLLSNFRILP